MKNHATTDRLAEHVVASQPSNTKAAIDAARTGLLDFLGVCLAGASDPGRRRLERCLASSHENVGTTVIGRPYRASLFDAVLLNGYAGHALDFDDQHGGARGHPSTVLLPALLGMGQKHGRSARQLLEAYVVGVEVMARVGRALGRKHYDEGFHSTATVGAVAAGAACAFLMNLDARHTQIALGLAASQSSGLRSQFGSDGKPLHAGLAARAGAFAAELAVDDFQGSLHALDGQCGYFSAFGLGAADCENIANGWGDPWQIVSPGLYFKPYPCCVAAHYAIEAALELRRIHKLRPDDIRHVTVTFLPGGDLPLQVRNPTTGLQGRFSVEYAVAVALVDGRLMLDSFRDVPIRPELAQVTATVQRRYDDSKGLASADPLARSTRVEVVTADGSTYSNSVGRLASVSSVTSKFIDCASSMPGSGDIPAIVAEIETREDLEKLIQRFAVSSL
jgi:2-methylcitrate dehydratase PrpD